MSIHSVQCTNDRPKTNKQNNSIQVQVYEPKCFNCGHLEEHAQGTTYKGVSSLPVATSIKKMPSQKPLSTICSQGGLRGLMSCLCSLKTPLSTHREVLVGPILWKSMWIITTGLTLKPPCPCWTQCIVCHSMWAFDEDFSPWMHIVPKHTAHIQI